MKLMKALPNLENVVEGVGVPGIAAIVILPFALPVVAFAGKKITKTAIKASIIAYEKSKGILATAGESFGDIVAEAKAELSEPGNKTSEPR